MELDEGRILFDATFTDAPPVGTHTYSLSRCGRKTRTPLCTAGGGEATARCTLTVAARGQSFYAGSIPVTCEPAP